MKKGLLKNPLVVTALLLIAIGFVFVNNILPFMKSDELTDNDVPEETIVQQDQVDIPVEPESLSLDGIQTIKVTNLLKNNLLETQGWMRTTSRDPFENKRTDTDNDKESIGAANATSVDVPVAIAVNSVVKNRRVKEKSILKAISIGITEKVALIRNSVCHEGDTCSLGIVKKIDPDSVIISGKNGIRILHLK